MPDSRPWKDLVPKVVAGVLCSCIVAVVGWVVGWGMAAHSEAKRIGEEATRIGVQVVSQLDLISHDFSEHKRTVEKHVAAIAENNAAILRLQENDKLVLTLIQQLQEHKERMDIAVVEMFKELAAMKGRSELWNDRPKP